VKASQNVVMPFALIFAALRRSCLFIGSAAPALLLHAPLGQRLFRP
jgi:hypothetical protein